MSPIDGVLLVVLLVLLPAYMLGKSLARRNRPPSNDRIRRYARSILLATVPTAAVAGIWAADRRPIAALGLGPQGQIGIVLVVMALLAIGALLIAAPRAKRPANPARNAEAEAMMPASPREVVWFVGFAVAVGVGWEVLYRGYLWWALAPLLGPAGAIGATGASYGVAHGYRGPGALIASIVAALLFAVAYALSQSLWWLIVIHVGLPLVGLRLRATPTR